MSTSDYIPRADADFDAWLQNFVDYTVANAAALGLAPAQVDSVQAVQTNWGINYPASISAQATANSAVQAKNDSRGNAEAVIRGTVGMIQANSAVSDAQRQALGITVRSTSRTAAGPPTSRPVAMIDTSQRLRHTINFSDESTPNSRAKPDGVQGCEIWMKVGDPAPAGPNELHYLALDTRTPYVTDFEAAHAGKTAYYMLRWISTRGETGPWSATVSGTITN
jgi:hypothetical protein